MAVLRIEGGELALHLSAAEKIGAVHGDLRVPLAAVSRVEVLEDAHSRPTTASSSAREFPAGPRLARCGATAGTSSPPCSRTRRGECG